MRIALHHLKGALQNNGLNLPWRRHTLLSGCRDECQVRDSYASLPWRQHFRGAKSKATVKIRDLPQGVLEGGFPAQEEPFHGPVYPTVIQQARMNMRKFENCVVLTRMGGFYEVRWPF